MRRILATFVLMLACATAAAGQTVSAAQTVTVADDAAQDAPPQLARERLVLRTNMGDLVLAFYSEVAPRHTAQILRLARAGLYDNLDFYRVEPSFVAQLSDVRGSKADLSAEQLSLVAPLPAEFNALKHERGTLSMARYEDRPDSAETSFSILLGAAPHLDGKYTIFGKLEAGYDVLDAIGRVARDARNRPLRPVVIRRAEVVESPEALAALSLRGPDFDEQQPPLFLLLKRGAWALGACALLGLTLFVVAARGKAARWAGSAGLLLVLVGFFGLLVALLPEARTSGWSSISLLAGIVILFKLMNRFESGRPPGRDCALRTGEG
jgi:cyclophilin family peptidyl-prolyl cis-trans isomerase